MKSKALVFLAVLSASLTANAGGSNPQNFWKRLLAQKTDINPAAPGPNAVGDHEVITPQIAWDKTRFNPNRMICVSHFDGYELLGVGNYEAVKRLLGPNLEPVVQEFAPGVKGVPVVMAATENIGYIGCSCPAKFEEFMINVQIKDPGIEDPATFSPATAHLAPIWWSTNHLKRQETMVNKFSVPEQFAGIPSDPKGESHIGFFKSGGEAGSARGASQQDVKGFYLKDQSGKTILTAKRTAGVIPAATTVVPFVDYLSYATQPRKFKFGGNKLYDLFGLDRTEMPGQYYRLQEPNHGMGYHPALPPPMTAFFAPGADSLEFDKNSELGTVLTRIQFMPLVWTSETFNNAMAWAPHPLPLASKK